MRPKSESRLEAPEALAQAAAVLLLEVMQDPALQTRYLRRARPFGLATEKQGLGKFRGALQLND